MTALATAAALAGTMLSAEASPRVYYVGPYGADTNDGLSPGAAFAAIGRAAAVAAAGDTVRIRAGR